MNASKLSAQQKIQIAEYVKCKKDIVYFCENYVKLATVGGDTSIKLYDPQKDFLKSLLNEHYCIALKSRQIGISTVTQLFVAYVFTFFKNVIVGIVSKSGPESTDFCRKTLQMIKSLPEWMRPEFSKETEQTFILDNGCQFYASQVNESNPESLFRGKSITILIIDEAAFIPKIDEAYTGCAPALFKSQTSAKMRGIPFATIIISTPNKTIGKGRWYYQEWKRSHDGDSIYKPIRIHWTQVKEFKDDPTWYKTQCELLGNVQWKIQQELEMQFVASSNSFLPADTIKELNECIKIPIRSFSLGNYQILQFEEPDKTKFYLIGIDVASRAGDDSSTIQIVDYETLRQVGEFKGKLRVDDFCRIITLVAKIYPNNLIIPESNSYGNQVCEYLTKSGSYYNIYQSKVAKTTATPGNTVKPKFRYGIYTGPQNRPLMMDALYTFITEEPTIVRSERTSLELIGLIDNGNGKISADEGEHDDLAMAYSFCCYVKMYDPPMAFSRNFLTTEGMQDAQDVVEWNDGPRISISTDIFSDEEMPEGRVDKVEKVNKIVAGYVKKNLDKMIEQNGNVIDLTKIMGRQ